MPKPITDHQREQWSSVHRKVLVLAEFFDAKASARGGEQVLQLTGDIRAAAQPAHPFAERFADLREALTDLLEMASYLPSGDLRDLDAHVRRRLGIGLDDFQTKRLARIAAVRAKGKVTTDEQFRLLKGRHEQIWDDPARAKEAVALAKLVEAYEMRKRRP